MAAASNRLSKHGHTSHFPTGRSSWSDLQPGSAGGSAVEWVVLRGAPEQLLDLSLALLALFRDSALLFDLNLGRELQLSVIYLKFERKF